VTEKELEEKEKILQKMEEDIKEKCSQIDKDEANLLKKQKELDKTLGLTKDSDLFMQFYENVNLSYEIHKILCGNLIVEFSNQYAVLKDNLIYKNLNTELFADQLEIDMLKRTTKISMFNKSDKVKIIENYGNN